MQFRGSASDWLAETMNGGHERDRWICAGRSPLDVADREPSSVGQVSPLTAAAAQYAPRGSCWLPPWVRSGWLSSGVE
jgi:hypothetical protein